MKLPSMSPSSVLFSSAKDFGLLSVLEVITNRNLNRKDRTDKFELIGYILNKEEITNIEAGEHRQYAASAIYNQHPELKNIQFPEYLTENNNNLTIDEAWEAIESWVKSIGNNFGNSFKIEQKPKIAPLDTNTIIKLKKGIFNN